VSIDIILVPSAVSIDTCPCASHKQNVFHYVSPPFLAQTLRFHAVVGAALPFSTSLPKNIFTRNQQFVSISEAHNRHTSGGEK
jgi:hypothetical protein